MKRRLDLAAALIHDPDILFLDEPTTGLDPESRAAVWEEVRSLNEQHGTTIFLTTQYLEEADELADRVGIISRGRLVAEGTPDELKRTVGTDVIVARVEQPDRRHARGAAARCPAWTRWSPSADEVTVHADRRRRRHEPRRPRPARRRGPRCAASPCARPRSTTSFSSSPGHTSKTRPRTPRPAPGAPPELTARAQPDGRRGPRGGRARDDNGDSTTPAAPPRRASRRAPPASSSTWPRWRAAPSGRSRASPRPSSPR